jgi:predicted TIM-barrel fold metal-dependent hydrolase
MLDGMFVFDNAIHVYDASPENVRGDDKDARYGVDLLTDLGAGLGWPGAGKTGADLRRRWSIDEVYDLVFVQAPTDMAMAQVVPLYEWFNNLWAPVEAQYAMAQRYPDRVLFCGGVDPYMPDLQAALEQLHHQVVDLGARSIKFYNGHAPRSWRCDDEKVAYPLYEKCRQLGVRVLQFHKGIPFGYMNVEDLSPVDLQRPARDFPDLIFLVHHLGVPYFEEMVSIASRFPNVHLSLAGNINAYHVAPRQVQKQVGRLLMEVGADKLVYGSDAALLGSPKPFLQGVLELEIPEDLRSGYGYPQFTREDKAKFLGLNFARLMGVDVDSKLKQLAAVR